MTSWLSSTWTLTLSLVIPGRSARTTNSPLRSNASMSGVHRVSARSSPRKSRGELACSPSVLEPPLHVVRQAPHQRERALLARERSLFFPCTFNCHGHPPVTYTVLYVPVGS